MVVLFGEVVETLGGGVSQKEGVGLDILQPDWLSVLSTFRLQQHHEHLFVPATVPSLPGGTAFPQTVRQEKPFLL